MEYNNLKDESAVILRPAYPYGRQQIWLPTDLHTVAARLESVGIKTDVIDLNFDQLPENIGDYDHIGIGVIGPPYISSSIKLSEEVMKLTGKKPMIGGPGTKYFSPEQFNTLYGDVIQIKEDIDLSSRVGRFVPSVYGISIADRIKDMDPERLKTYLSNEFSFFVSQGCKYACDFCSADRTRLGKKVEEEFSLVIENDLDAIVEKADEFGIPKLTMYITPLDLFQNRKQFREVLEIFADKNNKYNIEFELRGLSRINSFLSALEKEPKLYDLIPEAGLKFVGFGIDGTTAEVWKSQHKGNKNLSEFNRAFELCSQVGITPEALMVMGFHDQNGKPVDNLESLRKNVDYSIDIAETMGVIARPHVAKDMVPGNGGWDNPIWNKQRQQLLENPEFFKNLDFVTFASEITHPHEEFRHHVNSAYSEIVERLKPTGQCVTSPLMPYTGDESQDLEADNYNKQVPCDK